jgi:hypothetical protein
MKMEWIRTLLEQQPVVTLFLTIALGYLVGQISIKGFSVGVGAARWQRQGRWNCVYRPSGARRA